MAVPTVTVATGRCPACGSSSRTRYRGTKTVKRGFVLHQTGLEYTRKITRLTRCLTCGLGRRECSFEYHPADLDAPANGQAKKKIPVVVSV